MEDNFILFICNIFLSRLFVINEHSSQKNADYFKTVSGFFHTCGGGLEMEIGSGKFMKCIAMKQNINEHMRDTSPQHPAVKYITKSAR